MVFSAPTFLFLFLPGVLLACTLAPRAARNVVLLLASLFFYAWGETAYVVVMLASIAFNYAAGLALDHFPPEDQRVRRGVLALAVAGNLGLLGWFKYAGFLGTSLAAAWTALGLGVPPFDPAPLKEIHLPIGISFFTFQALSYVVDVYRGTSAAQRNPIRLALFVSLFPQLIAGPIVRYHDIAAQLARRTVAVGDFAEGIRRFTIGLAKKLLIANTLAAPVDAIFALSPDELSVSVAWLGALCYTLQIYFDFSGYSDMAIGLGRMLGFRFPENFDLPYVATSITAFWRRWHMSLSRWFRDYLYIPLGGSRRGPVRTYANLLVVFVLCGLWHGASWSFVAWGLFHGAFLVLERAPLTRALTRLPGLAGHLYCMLAVVCGWVLFRAESLPHAVGYLAAMAGVGAGAWSSNAMVADYASPEALAVMAVGVACSGPWTDHARNALRQLELRALRDGGIRHFATAWATTAGLAALWFGCAMKLASRTYDPFLYFRF